MNKAFKKQDEVKIFEVYTDFFENMKRKDNEKINDYINRFDKNAILAKKYKMELPSTVLGLKLLANAGVSAADRKLVLSEVNFSTENEVYEKAKQGLAKYAADMNKCENKIEAIKLDSALTAEEEEALIARGWNRPPKGKKKEYGGSTAKGNGNQTSQLQKKKINPKGENGEILICPSCGSYRHLLAECPDSYENQAKMKSKAFAAEALAAENNNSDEESSLFTSNLKASKIKINKYGEAEDVILFTKNKTEILNLSSECLGSVLLDCGCSRNVMGEAWRNSYYASLPPVFKEKVKEFGAGKTQFRFGGGEVLPSLKSIKFPGILAGKSVTFTSHLVSSNIPLLWSRPSMAKAGTVLDLPQDRAKIFGNWIPLNLTSVGHYAIDILPKETNDVEQCLLTLPNNQEEKYKVLLKLHRQFGHPRLEVMLNLLQKVNCNDKETKKLVETIYGKCNTCKLFTTTPPRPVVSLPAASEFSQVLTLDLKEIKVQNYKFILHMIDGFTRFAVSVFIRDKKPETILHNVMRHWISYFGRPGKIWTDVGGEFNNDIIRQLGETIGTRVETGAGYSAWMNGLNERNHCIVDRCFGKIMTDFPKMDPSIALAWAVTAKNSYPMHGGFSSYQLVYGKNPKLPNIMEDKLPALEGATTRNLLKYNVMNS